MKTKQQKQKIGKPEPLTATRDFYNQVKILKTKLPNNWRDEIIKVLPPEYNTLEGGKIINRVYNCVTTDVVVLVAMIEISK